VNRLGRNHKQHSLPTSMVAGCKEIADEIRGQNESVRYDKVLVARMRISDGYYNSSDVLRVIASRLLEEGDIR